MKEELDKQSTAVDGTGGTLSSIELPDFPPNQELPAKDRPEFPQHAVAHYLAGTADVVRWLFTEKLGRSKEERMPTERGRYNTKATTKPHSFVFLEQDLRDCAKKAYESKDFGQTCRGSLNKMFYNADAGLICLKYLLQHPELHDEKVNQEVVRGLTNGMSASLVAIGKASALKDGVASDVRLRREPKYTLTKPGILQLLYKNKIDPERNQLAQDISAYNFFGGGVREAMKLFPANQRINSAPDMGNALTP